MATSSFFHFFWAKVLGNQIILAGRNERWSLTWGSKLIKLQTCYWHCVQCNGNVFMELNFCISGEKCPLVTPFHSKQFTYIIGHYNPSVRIIGLVSHTTYVCLYISGGGTYSLKSTPNDRFFGETFHGNFIYSQRAERGNRRRNNFRISFWWLAWYSKPWLFV